MSLPVSYLILSMKLLAELQCLRRNFCRGLAERQKVVQRLCEEGQKCWQVFPTEQQSGVVQGSRLISCCGSVVITWRLMFAL